MSDRTYYSIRTGKNPQCKYDISILRRLFCETYKYFLRKDYFQEAFGFECTDAGYIEGTLGGDLEAQIFRRLRKFELWPIEYKASEYSEDDLFDVIEFLFDYISKPVDGHYHDWNQCGYHFYSFDREKGRQEFRSEINEFLLDYKDGFELSKNGEILTLPENGLEHIYHAFLPTSDFTNVEARVNAAVLKFRRHASTLEDRRDSVRDLADVLEFLRPTLKQVLRSDDEKDLFNLANNFGIRHHNRRQKANYDKSIWLSWMYYYYLATIHTSLRLIKKSDKHNDT